jgi:hypothetical protein
MAVPLGSTLHIAIVGAGIGGLLTQYRILPKPECWSSGFVQAEFLDHVDPMLIM